MEPRNDRTIQGQEAIVKNVRWKELGGQAGIGLAIAGFLLIFLGWNGAATYDRGPAQFPYLISGGLAGLALVILAAAVLVVNAQRQDRAALLNGLAELTEAVERMSLTAASGGSSRGIQAYSTSAAVEDGFVVAGPTTYHRPTCKLLEGRGGLATVSVEAAQERGLAPCRACDASDLALPMAELDDEPEVAGRRRRNPARSTR
ncbi:MAG: hypothetical protein ACR2K6_06940 [Solirubrobacterales bacterium]